MPDVKWIKVATDVFEDEKIKIIEAMPKGDAVINIWFKLLCLAGKQNNGGVFMMGNQPFTNEMFATIFGKSIGIIKQSFQIFSNFGMIKIENGAVTLANWQKYQTLDAIEKRRDYMKQIMADKRNKQKTEPNDGQSVSKSTANKMLTVSNEAANKLLTVSSTEVEVDTDTDIDIDTTAVAVVSDGGGECANKMSFLGKLGKGVVMLSSEQIDSLLCKLTKDEFDYYVERLANFILSHPDASIKSHYSTILKWAKEDRRT